MNDPGARREQPGVIPLRPLGLAEIMQGALATIRKQPALLLGGAFVVVLITGVIQIAVTRNLAFEIPSLDPEQQQMTAQQMRELLVPLATRLGITLAVGLVTKAFLSGLSISVVGRTVLGGTLPAGQAWRELRSRLLPLFGVTIVYSLLVALGPAVAVLLVTGTGGADVSVLFLLVGLGVALWLYVRFSLAMPALVLEPASIGNALRRSTALVRGAWGRTFGILLTAWAISFLLSMAIELLFSGFSGTQPGAADTVGTTVLAGLGMIVAGTITQPFIAAVTALVYVDRRMRVENMAVSLRESARGS